MFTIDEMKNVLDQEGYDTIDGYNAIRVQVMSMANEAVTESADLNSQIENLKMENDRLKSANSLLYSRIERQFVGDDKSHDNDNDNDDGRKQEDESIKTEDVVNVYKRLFK